MPKTLCINQARMGSTRLPGKALLEVQGKTLLEYMVERIRRSKKIDTLVIATTTKSEDDKIVDVCKKIRVDYFRGSENDVLDRYYQVSLRYPEYETIVRLTADCPINDPRVMDHIIKFFEDHRYDYVSNTIQPTYPNGMDVEVFTKKSLEIAHKEAVMSSEREHVVPYIKNNPQFKTCSVKAEHDFSHFRLTVDNPEDFEVIKFIIENSDIADDYMTYISLLTKHPEVMIKNWHIERDEGMKKSLAHDFRIR